PICAVSDFTTGGGSVVVNWGDGTVVTLPGADITLAGGTFSVTAGHNYAEAGQYTITTTITDQGGSQTIARGLATISDAPLTPGAPPVVTVQEGTSFTLPVGTFKDGNPSAPVTDFRAVIDWGDNTAQSFGTVTEAGGVFTVTGTHAYASF